jgi:hypothetical protein
MDGGVGIVADAGHPPEGIGHYAHGAAGRGRPVEWRVVLVRHARHDQRPARADSGKQRFQQMVRG